MKLFFIMTAIGSCAASAAAGEANIVFRANSEFRTVDMKQLEICPGSALDLSDWNEVPAGKYGRVNAVGSDELFFPERPGTPVRFFGFNWITGAGMKLDGSPAENSREIRRFARAVRRQGYNIIRLHALDIFLMDHTTETDGEFSPRRLEQFDEMVEAFKAEGIYLYLDLAMYGWVHGGWSGSSRNTKIKIFFNDDNSRELWKRSVLRLLEHRNRISGLRVREEPAVAAVLFWNEQDLVLLSPSLTQAPNERIQKAFREWLKNRYGTFEALRKTWKNIPDNVSDFNSIKMKHSSRVSAGPVREDMSRFYLELMENIRHFYCSVLKQSGYRGLYTLWDAAKNRRSSVARKELPLLCSHDYTAHPSAWMHPGSRVGQGSSLDEIWYFRTMAQTRQWRKPFMITEYGHGFWNPYLHEAGLAMSGYSALQNYAGLMVHCNAVLLRPYGSLQDFGQGINPISRANEFLAAHLFRRGDIAPSPTKLEIPIPPGKLLKNGELEGAVNAEQTKLAFLAGFGITVSDRQKKTSAGTIRLGVEPGTETGGTAWTNTFLQTGDAKGFSLAAEVKELKQRGILPEKNITDPAKGIFESSTGELTLFCRESRLQAITGRTEAVSMLAGNWRLNTLQHISTNVPAMVALISRDGKPLDQSRRMVLIYATEAVNSNMELSSDRRTLIRRGDLPVLLKNGMLEVKIHRSATAPPLSCFALAINGERREMLPLTQAGDQVTLKLNTAILREYTPFFELTENP